MADTATPDTADSPKLAAEKDRSCPFCGTKFTSSSLGRHLDLYIKERNPKAPDGIHDVEEIRKLRGNVTRRQVKLSISKREGSTPTSSKTDSLRGQRSPSATASTLPKQRDGGSVKIGINTPNWTSTGVINDLPPSVEEGAENNGKRRNSARRLSVKAELTRKHMALEERDRARAAELALRDVLGTLKAAKYRFLRFALRRVNSANHLNIAHAPILTRRSTSIYSAFPSQRCACDVYLLRRQSLLGQASRKSALGPSSHRVPTTLMD